jgi:hypothetical protein
LLKAGTKPQEAKRLIACVVASEILGTQKNEQPFDHARYVKALD